MRAFLAIHALLLVLASTEFTVATSFFRGDRFHWSYFQYAWKSGFGQPYVADYTLPVVLTYLAAFAFGVIGFRLALGERPIVGLVGLVLSIVGLISFAIEGSHWIFDHHRSLIAIIPAAMMILAFVGCLPRRGFDAEQGAEVAELG